MSSLQAAIGKFLVIFLLLFVSGSNKALAVSEQQLNWLAEDLATDLDISRAEIRRLLDHPKLSLIEKETVDLNLTKPLKLSESRYAHFTDAYAIGLAKKFSRRWRTSLNRAFRRYGVDPQVIVAILLIETSFGRYTGSHHLLSIFVSTYLEAYDLRQSEAYTDFDDKTRARIERKMNWARAELLSLLKIAKLHPRLGVLDLEGSYAGAFGKSQFLPSSYLNYAVRARDELSPNLFFEPDAIHSIANYLKEHGYRRSWNSPDSAKAIYAYNNSQVYVNVVQRIASKLAGK